MVEVDNCLIYEFYNVVKFLAAELILAEVFINAEVVCGQSERKGKDAARAHHSFFFHRTRGTLKHILLKDRNVIFFKFRKIHSCFNLNTDNLGRFLRRQIKVE